LDPAPILQLIAAMAITPSPVSSWIKKGNLYGTTYRGGTHFASGGIAFMLLGGKESILWNFGSGLDVRMSRRG